MLTPEVMKTTSAVLILSTILVEMWSFWKKKEKEKAPQKKEQHEREQETHLSRIL